jgi:hypothetical protein
MGDMAMPRVYQAPGDSQRAIAGVTLRCIALAGEAPWWQGLEMREQPRKAGAEMNSARLTPTASR